MDSFQSFVVPGVAKYHGPSRDMRNVDTIVVHTTVGHSTNESVSWLNRVLKTGESGASYHYVVSADHKIVRMLPVLYVAYHAGVSQIPPTKPLPWESVNKRSIGIALDTMDDPSDPISQWQMDALLWLCQSFYYQYLIHPDNVFGHKEVAPGRKHDPALVDMEQFRSTLRASL